MKLLPVYFTFLLSVVLVAVNAQPIPDKVQQTLDRFRTYPVGISASPDFVKDLSSIEWHRLAKCWNYTGNPQYFRQLQKNCRPLCCCKRSISRLLSQ